MPGGRRDSHAEGLSLLRPRYERPARGRAPRAPAGAGGRRPQARPRIFLCARARGHRRGARGGPAALPRPQAPRHPQHRRRRRARRGRPGAPLRHPPRRRRPRHDAGRARGGGGGSRPPGLRPAEPARRDRAHQPRRPGAGAPGHRRNGAGPGAAPRRHGAGGRPGGGDREPARDRGAQGRARRGLRHRRPRHPPRRRHGGGGAVSARGDQARVATPAEAAQAGATALVVGRPITRAPDPLAAARAIAGEIAAAS